MKARIVTTYPLEADGSEYVFHGSWQEVEDTAEGLEKLDALVKRLQYDTLCAVVEVEIQGNTIPDLKMEK